MKVILYEYGSLMVAIVAFFPLLVLGIWFMQYYRSYSKQIIAEITGNSVSYDTSITLTEIENMEG